jgi:serine/threonine protein kinase
MDKYRVLGPRGYGAQSTVYSAVRTSDSRAVYLKRFVGLFAADPSRRDQILATCATVRALEHNHVVQIMEYFPDGEDLVVIMPAATCSVREAIKANTALSSEELLVVAAAVADGLCFLHAKGVIHRDVKPESILLMPRPGALPTPGFVPGEASITDDAPITADGPTGAGGGGGGGGATGGGPTAAPAPALITAGLGVTHKVDILAHDVVLADALDASLLAEVDPSHTVLGTRAYMAPEVLSEEVPFSPEADVWSVGASLYASATSALIGGTPADRASLMKGKWSLQGAVDRLPAESKARWESLPTPVKTIIADCLALEPEARPTAPALAAHPATQQSRSVAKERSARERDTFARKAASENISLRGEKLRLEEEVRTLTDEIATLIKKNEDAEEARKKAADALVAANLQIESLRTSHPELESLRKQLAEAKKEIAVLKAQTTTPSTSVNFGAPVTTGSTSGSSGTSSQINIQLPGSPGAVYGMCPVGQSAIAITCGGSDHIVHVYDSQKGTPVAKLTGHTDTVHGVCTLPDGRLASCGYDQTVRIWTIATRSCELVLKGHVGHVYDVCALRDGRLASGGVDGKIRIWDTTTGTCVGELVGHSKPVFPLILMPDGRLLSGSDDRTFRVWDVDSMTCLRTVSGHGRWPSGLGLLPNGRVVASSDRIRVFDPSSNWSCLQTLTEDMSQDTRIAVLPDGRVATGSYSGNALVRLWDTTRTSQTPGTMKGPASAPVNFVLPLPDGRVAIASGTQVRIDTPPPHPNPSS